MTDLKIIPLSGLRENGKNMYAVEYGDEIVVMDCGLQYPENELLGIDIVIPDLTYIKDNIEKVVGIFLTHGHADAIGSLPYLISDYDIPVFGSKLTIELAKIIVNQDKRSRKFNNFQVVDAKTAIDFDKLSVSFFKTTHSIPDSLGIVVDTPEGQIVYTGDFKFDQSAPSTYQTDYQRLATIGSKKVLALLSDSANAESPYPAADERDIYNYIWETFEYQTGRIIVASVASNIQRMQQIFDAAQRTGRKVVLTGQSAAKIVRTAIKLGYLQLADDLLVSASQAEKLPKDHVVIIETGRMGEPIKILQKMATSKHHFYHIEEGDLVFITTTPSHAMETTVAKTRDLIFRAGGEVKSVTDSGLYTSGHAAKSDLQLMINILHPQNLLPVQGEYRNLNMHATIAVETGVPADNVFLLKNGDVLSYDQGSFHLAQAIQAGDTMIDGMGVGDIGTIVLRDRKLLSQDGVFIAVVTIDRKKKKVVAQPKVTARGFIYLRDNRELLSESINVITQAVQNNLDHKDFDWSELKQDIREDLNHFLWEKTKRHPVILPVVMEVNQNRHRKAHNNTVKS
ncbi:ribonuclease J [Bombilactobacillus thymidiniphilus]|uniref:Ribonuclease J n=1 Tax=Bombilactobacillus thymidiniphilus TaxID=2923363 RepID=A0ABY4PE22_9LACO|nr:ribonuclease J [Bombilactobacillus thymidiniphilus]UQS83751.1 ribonuclease J [Bombilactobacillus thymidiniphilus]